MGKQPDEAWFIKRESLEREWGGVDNKFRLRSRYLWDVHLEI